MKAATIIIGDEILIGQVVDTNSSWISREINQIGIHTEKVITVGDSGESISSAIDRCFEVADIVFMTGGLGPTKDDITKKIICQKFNTELVLNEQVLENVTRILSKRGIAISGNNRDQALVPKTATVINNAVGTAPAMLMQQNGKMLFSMPGVPFEMQYIMQNEIIPFLSKNFASQAVFHKTLLLTGIAESILAEKIADWEDSLPQDIKLAYLPAYSSIRLRLSCYNPTSQTEHIVG
ncbi:MAG: competence/damage-inducible protein A, partial [Bacteroidales bacterium]|nr:competence/damage-inducible protein A [Bacteroidales bacterium]